MESKKKETHPSSHMQVRFTELTTVAQTILVRRSNRKFSPPTDVIELPDRLVVLVEIAGMQTEDFRIALIETLLVITGVRERPMFDHPAYYQAEIGFGKFRIEIRLPWHVEKEKVSAAYSDGFLQIDLPRRSHEIYVTDIHTEEQEQV